MERINNTPLPFVHVAHLRAFLIAYLFAMPVVYASLWGLGSPFYTALIALALLGIEAAAVV
jgi:predicted membrane chloride channel (bestrophin family)